MLLLVICGSVATPPAYAVTIVEQERGTFARSHVIRSPNFQEDVEASETRTLEAFDAMATSNAHLLPLVATSSAWLESSLGTRTTRAQGGATSILVAPESGRRAEAPADSFFEIIFDVEEEQPFRLQGQVDSLALDSEAFAFVELLYYGILVIAEHTAGGGEYDRFDDTGTLAAGRYRLTALALSYGETAGDASSPAALASFQLAFEVPEPTSNTGAGISLLVLAGLARARRRSR
ncbi:MAG: hypothetical protein VCC19_16635 [Myxococcota bacterium]